MLPWQWPKQTQTLNLSESAEEHRALQIILVCLRPQVIHKRAEVPKDYLNTWYLGMFDIVLWMVFEKFWEFWKSLPSKPRGACLGEVLSEPCNHLFSVFLHLFQKLTPALESWVEEPNGLHEIRFSFICVWALGVLGCLGQLCVQSCLPAGRAWSLLFVLAWIIIIIINLNNI